MLHFRIRKIGSFLGLLAILMATLVPAISQAMSTKDSVEALLSSYCSAQPGPGANEGDQSSHTMLLHLQPCGYCSLFSDMPAVPTAETTFSATVWAVHHHAATRFDRLQRVLLLTAAQPRAPPFPV